jgi:hypothetical protein
MAGPFLSVVNYDKELKYDGSQLSSHFIYKNTGVMGDACISFIGACDIPYKYMVDLEDELAKDTIYSTKMLHFIVELFARDIYFGVLFQNVIISEIQNELLAYNIKKHGDDLFFEDKKLSISICTVSLVSALIHIGINISSKDTPVKTISLNDLNVDFKLFQTNILNRLEKEYTRIFKAVSKVKPVS